MKLTLLISILAAASGSWAQEFPQIVREGTDATIKAEDISDIQSWEGKSKEALDNGRKEIEKLDTAKKRSAYAVLLGEVVRASGNRENELLMRVTLNRALTMNDVLIANSKLSGQQDGLARRIFRNSIKVALLVYDDDTKFLNNTKNAGQNEIAFNLPFASVGIKSAEYFARQSMLAPSHQANYVMLVETLGWFFRDLNRDAGRQKFKAILDRVSEFEAQVVSQSKPVTPSDYLRLETKIKAFLDDQIELAKQQREGVNSKYEEASSQDEKQMNVVLDAFIKDETVRADSRNLVIAVSQSCKTPPPMVALVFVWLELGLVNGVQQNMDGHMSFSTQAFGIFERECLNPIDALARANSNMNKTLDDKLRDLLRDKGFAPFEPTSVEARKLKNLLMFFGSLTQVIREPKRIFDVAEKILSMLKQTPDKDVFDYTKEFYAQQSNGASIDRALSKTKKKMQGSR